MMNVVVIFMLVAFIAAVAFIAWLFFVGLKNRNSSELKNRK
jgi:hypothetical protein